MNQPKKERLIDKVVKALFKYDFLIPLGALLLLLLLTKLFEVLF